MLNRSQKNYWQIQRGPLNYHENESEKEIISILFLQKLLNKRTLKEVRKKFIRIEFKSNRTVILDKFSEFHY